jgi:hypothetical protein
VAPLADLNLRELDGIAQRRENRVLEHSAKF